MSLSLKIMIIPMDALGHINPCLGLADIVTKKGHSVVFVVAKEWQQIISDNHYSTEVYPVAENRSNNLESWSKLWKIEENELNSNKQKPSLILKAYYQFWKLAQERDGHLKQMIQKIKPDLIIVDQLISLPAVESSNIPWVVLYSANPIRMYYEHCPPADSGFSIDSDPKLWKEYQDKLNCELEPFKKGFENWLLQSGIKLNSIDFLNDSPFLNIYVFPETLDYTDITHPLKKWYRIDHLIHGFKNQDIGLPLNFLNQPGYLIYLSLGSLGGANVKLMKKLISILNKTTYKVIVSKGPSHSEYKLGPRMWGGPFLNQLKILPLVDIVISHGGNNTLAECLYFAKPMIVIPLFGDQLDTAERLKHKKLGIRLNPFEFSEEQLLAAIRDLIADQDLKAKLKTISKELQNSKRSEVLVTLLEKTAVEKKCPLI